MNKRTIFIGLFSLLIIIGGVMSFAVVRSGIYQEDRPIKLTLSIINSTIFDKEYIEYNTDPFLYVAKFSDGSYSSIKTVMENKGWLYKDQVGSGLVFEKDGEQITIATKNITRFYYIWESKF
ncbi:hypothetical protein [Bacillus sp. SM2101]|uniref:hypothetical protein n=1 Tax=Bacillus sp. SM2101 TaxID=2805366 RepID=UPI001BDEB24F|nr:hypothetical protein [Bacillus sp. SM2101]